MNPNVNYDLKVTVVCQNRLICCNACTTSVWVVDYIGGSPCAGAVSICETSEPFSQFCCKPNTALTQSSIFFFKFVKS